MPPGPVFYLFKLAQTNHHNSSHTIRFLTPLFSVGVVASGISSVHSAPQHHPSSETSASVPTRLIAGVTPPPLFQKKTPGSSGSPSSASSPDSPSITRPSIFPSSESESTPPPDVIFGIRLGAGGVKRCAAARRVSGNSYHDYFILPKGVRAGQNSTLLGQAPRDILGQPLTNNLFQEGSKQPCFASTSGNAPLHLEQEEPHRAEVGVYFPRGKEPQVPKGMYIKSNTDLESPYIAGYTYGKRNYLVELLLSTAGIGVQNSVMQTLTNKFGEPKTSQLVNVYTSGGKVAKSQEAVWESGELVIFFQGITGGVKLEGNEFGAGLVRITTKEGLALRGERVDEQQPKGATF